MVYGLPLITFAVLFNFSRFYEITVLHLACPRSKIADNPSLNMSYCINLDNANYGINLSTKNETAVEFYRVTSTELRDNPYYIKFYITYSNFLIHAVIPFAALITLNIHIYKQVMNATITVLSLTDHL